MAGNKIWLPPEKSSTVLADEAKESSSGWKSTKRGKVNQGVISTDCGYEAISISQF